MLQYVESPLCTFRTDPSSEVSVWALTGAAFQLAMAHEDTSQQRLHEMMERFIAALEAEQSHLLLDDQGRPWAFASWILADHYLHERWLTGDTSLPDKWQVESGLNTHRYLWFVDFIVPFGNQLQALRRLQALLPEHGAAWTFNLLNGLQQKENPGNLPPRQLW